MSDTLQPNASSPALTPQQERAAEMIAAGQRVGEVADAVGVDRATVWRWTRNPEFQEVTNGLRCIARRAAADKVRANAALAADVLAAIMSDSAVPARDRVSAARAALGAAGPLFPQVPKGAPEPVESLGVPPVSRGDWRSVMTETARQAGLMAGHPYISLSTPGIAWAESGLEAQFPGSFVRVRAFADAPEALRAACEELLREWQDALDAAAIEEAREEAARQ